MSPARSRSSALAAFVGAKGRGNSTPDVGSKTKTKSKSKSKKERHDDATQLSEKIPDDDRVEIDERRKRSGRAPGKSKACAPFKPANGDEKQREAMWEAQDTAVAVDVSLDVAPSSRSVSGHPPPPGLPVRTGILKARAHAGKENVKEHDGGKEGGEKEKKEDEVTGEDSDMALSARDLRAYEHERQRVKKAGERAARMARKEKAHIVSAGGGGGRSVKAWEDAEYVVHSSAKAHKRGEDERHTTVTPAAKRSGEEISLSELVKLKPKGHGQRAARGEEGFELVPAVRAVIVLDEAEFGDGKRDMEVDDWECVDIEVKEGLSYAQVVLGLHID